MDEALHGFPLERGSTPNEILSATKLGISHKAALDSCDALDGVKDDLIEDPRKCHFDLTTLQCTGADAPDCLTPAQIGAVQKIYQGPVRGDVAIPPRDSIAYYESVEAFLKQFPDPRNRASTRVQDFYRLFMVPGMGHCGGGVGPRHFGNDDIVDPKVTPQDAEHDLLSALDRWSMEDVTPDRIVAIGDRVSVEGDDTKRVKLTRPLCPYPQVAKYQGTGDTDEPVHFACGNEASAGRP